MTSVSSAEQSMYQLIKLYKRFEQDAKRNHRKGYVRPIVNTLNMEATSGFKTTGKLESDFSKEDFRSNDDFFQELLRAQIRLNEDEMNFKREQLTLRLPKLQNISQENKAIFFTALPVVPSIKGSDIKRRLSKKKRPRKDTIYGVNTFIKIQPLLGDDAVENDIHAISKVTESNCMTGYGVLPNIGVSQTPRKPTSNIKYSDTVSAPKHDFSVTQSRKLKKGTELSTNFNKDITPSSHKTNLGTAHLQLNSNTISSQKWDNVMKSTQVTQSADSSLRERFAKSNTAKLRKTFSNTRNDLRSNDVTTPKECSDGVTQVKVTVVTQDRSDLLNKYRFKVGKTPLNSPRDGTSLNSLKHERNVEVEGHQVDDLKALPTSSKSERNVHFSHHLTEIHRYSPLSPRLKQ